MYIHEYSRWRRNGPSYSIRQTWPHTKRFSWPTFSSPSYRDTSLYSYFVIETYSRSEYFRTQESYEPWRGVHETNALPVIFLGQLHMGKWLTTIHSALTPHVPTQGSRHLWNMHALSRRQSVLITHSGRQPAYGSPKYSSMHVQIPLLHWAFWPHGDGLHRSGGGTEICTGQIAAT